jgi:hypothetical protein
MAEQFQKLNRFDGTIENELMVLRPKVKGNFCDKMILEQTFVF